jgi:hypothetical protein
MEELDTRRKTDGECAAAAAWMGFARTRVLQRATARAPSRVKARLPLNARPGTESAHLLLPVMISRKPRFAWRFQAITGEIFFARNGSSRAGHAGSNARKFAGRKAPAPASQAIEFKQYFGVRKNSQKIGAQFMRASPFPAFGRTSPARVRLRPAFAEAKLRLRAGRQSFAGPGAQSAEASA